MTFKAVALENLQRGQYQPREDFEAESLQELADSIRSQGLIEPLVVREVSQNRYEIIAGERRWRAARLAGLTEVPCLIGNYTDQQACAVTLIENIQRQDLNVIEEATGYRRLVDEFFFQQDDIAALVGKSRSHIANILRLLTLDESVKIPLRERRLSLGHARLLVGLTSREQANFVNHALNEAWSVRQLEQAVRAHKKNPPGDVREDKDVLYLQNQLSEQLGAPVQIVSETGTGGWLKVKFFNNETLSGLLDRLGLRYD